MRTHLRKLAAFAVLQSTLLAIAVALADPPVVAPTAFADSTPTPRQRLQHSLHEQLLRVWLADPEVVDRARSRGPEDRTVRRAFERFRSDEDGYLMSIVEKDRLLRTAPGRRLILLGGSNLAFGTDSQIFAERYGVTPVNLGIHETLRAGYQLSHVAANVRRGDVVVFCFEYGTLLCGCGAADPELEKQICEHLPSMKQHFAVEQPAAASSDEHADTTAADWKEYSDGLALAEFAAFSRSTADRFSRRLGRLPLQVWNHGLTADDDLRRQFDAEYQDIEPRLLADYERWIAGGDVYRRSGFNIYGDFVGHYGQTSDRAFSRTGPAQLRPEQRTNVETSLAILNSWTAAYRAKGATVLFAYPTLCGLGKQSFATDLEDLVRKRLDAAILFPIAQAGSRPEEHYDTGYHLNWQGICRRMRIWTTALDRHLPPQIDLTPAEHVARRNENVRGTMFAELPTATVTQ